VIRHISLVIAALLLSANISRGESVKTSIDFHSDQWVIRDEKAKVEEYKGKKAICLRSPPASPGPGIAYFKDLTFENGTIECDIASPVKTAYLGIVFRMQSEDNYELVYFQPHTSGQWDAVQYDPVFNGSTTWQLYHGTRYQAPAEIPTERWFHVKLVVHGLRAEVYLDRSDTPCLTVNDLKHGHGKGYVGVWSYFPGNMSNLTVQPDTTAGPRDALIPRGCDPTYLTQWMVSEPFVSGGADVDIRGRAAEKSTKWQLITAEPPGLVNLSRYFKKPPGKATILAKATLHSQRKQTKRLLFGYSDEISVFLNSNKLFSGDNSYDSKHPGYRGYVKDGENAIELALEEGDNELLLAISEKAFGWGFICHLDDAEGISINAAAGD